MSATTRRVQLAVILFAIMAPVVLGAVGRALGADHVMDANRTAGIYKSTDAGLASFFEKAVGYAVFPGVGKGAAGVGGAHGTGILFERGKASGKATLNQVTVGLQLGGQNYSEIIFFENAKALSEFKGSTFAFSAQASAVALKSGASTNAPYRNGVAVFTATRAGLMFEASVGGQKFSFEPFPAKS